MICSAVYSWMISTDIEFLIIDTLLDMIVNPTEEEKKNILNNRPKFIIFEKFQQWLQYLINK